MNASESEKKEKIQNAFRKLTGDIRRKSIALKKKKETKQKYSTVENSQIE